MTQVFDDYANDTENDSISNEEKIINKNKTVLKQN